jgi:hypothetical protein
LSPAPNRAADADLTGAGTANPDAANNPDAATNLRRLYFMTAK